MSIYGAPNPIVRPILRSRFHRLLSDWLLLITVTGKKSGHRFTFPVLYARDGRDIVIVAAWASKKKWWKNVIGGADVELLVGGGKVLGRATAFVGDPTERGRALRAYLRRFPKSASTLGVASPLAALDDEALGSTQGDTVVVRVVPAARPR